MKNSPIFPKSEMGDDYDGFDPHVSFSKFLEEAKNYASQVETPAWSPFQKNTVAKGPSEDGKKKKSWKHSLFSWLKKEKKSKPAAVDPSVGPCISIAKHTSVSGPIYGSGRKGLIKRQISGPLTGLFTPSRNGDAEVPYMCLEQINHPNVQFYGPVYLVT